MPFIPVTNPIEALTAILAEMGLELKQAKTRTVQLREGGEGLDFLGFHHRYVRGNTQGHGTRSGPGGLYRPTPQTPETVRLGGRWFR